MQQVYVENKECQESRFVYQGGGKRLPNYDLVGENCVLVGENLFDPPDLVGESICLLKFMSLKICLLGGSEEREGLTNYDCNQVLFKAFTMTNFQNFLLLWSHCLRVIPLKSDSNCMFS